MSDERRLVQDEILAYDPFVAGTQTVWVLREEEPKPALRVFEPMIGDVANFNIHFSVHNVDGRHIQIVAGSRQ